MLRDISLKSEVHSVYDSVQRLILDSISFCHFPCSVGIRQQCATRTDSPRLYYFLLVSSRNILFSTAAMLLQVLKHQFRGSSTPVS